MGKRQGNPWRVVPGFAVAIVPVLLTITGLSHIYNICTGTQPGFFGEGSEQELCRIVMQGIPALLLYYTPGFGIGTWIIAFELNNISLVTFRKKSESIE